jgi:pantothenate synthetase
MSTGIKKIDYLEVLDVRKILNKKTKKKKFKIFLAYYIKKIRLIDNF